MTATSHTPEPAAADEYATLCEQARDLAQNGHLKRAARLYEQVLDEGPEQHRARAALGLAVVRHDLGDIAAARAAGRRAVEDGHPEFSPRAAYHLALSYEQEDAVAEARAEWERLLGFGNESYLPAAHYGLARIAEREGSPAAAHPHWQRVLDSKAGELVASAAQDYAQRLLMRGEAQEAMAVLQRGREAGDAPGLRVLIAAAHVEQAIAHLSEAVADTGGDPETGRLADPGSTAAAVELLARLLVVRSDSEGAAETWEYGLTHPDTGFAADVRQRLRRGFPEDPQEAGPRDGSEPQEEAWWVPYAEAATASDTAPLLAGELFTALTRIYVPIAAAHAGEEADPRVLHELLAAAVHAPGDYAWGPALFADFRERMRRSAGSGEHVLPEGWPETR